MDNNILTPVPRPFEGEKPPNAWPSEIREAAIDLAIELKSARKAGKHLGIPVRTIQYWLAEEVASGDANAWDAYAVKEIQDKIEQVLARIGPDKIDKAGLRDLVIAAGILLDKRQNMIPKAKAETPPTRLRIAWKDGSGAVEVENGK